MASLLLTNGRFLTPHRFLPDGAVLFSKTQSFGKIAKESGRDRKSIETAVKNLAALIDLPLRPPSPPGRPKGSKAYKRGRPKDVPTIAEISASP